MPLCFRRQALGLLFQQPARLEIAAAEIRNRAKDRSNSVIAILSFVRSIVPLAAMVLAGPLVGIAYKDGPPPHMTGGVWRANVLLVPLGQSPQCGRRLTPAGRCTGIVYTAADVPPHYYAVPLLACGGVVFKSRRDMLPDRRRASRRASGACSTTACKKRHPRPISESNLWNIQRWVRWQGNLGR